MSAVARRHGLAPQQLFGWRRQARPGAQGAVEEDGPVFTPVVAEPYRPPGNASIASAALGGTRMIEIVLGAATVRVPPGIDAVSVATVLRALKAAT